MPPSASLLTVIAGFCVVFVSTICISPIRHIFNLTSNAKKSNPGGYSIGNRWIYRDDDGEALDINDVRPRLQSVFIQVLVPTFVLFEILLTGLRFSLCGSSVQYILIAGGWVLVGLDVLIQIRQHSQPRKFAIGTSIAVSTAILCFVSIVTRGSETNDLIEDGAKQRLLQIIFSLEMIIGICLVWLNCSVPRRPNVYFKCQVVDGQFTTSVIGTATFSWIWPLLNQARAARRIEYDDLPCLDYVTRSQTLQNRFPINRLRSQFNSSGQPLWKIIIVENIGTLMRQWVIAIAESISIMLPPVCLYQVLSLLEQRTSEISASDNSSPELWFWVLCLTVSKTLHVGLDQWVQWYSSARLAIPIRSQLSAVIFAKSMLVKAIEGIDIKKNKHDPAHDRQRDAETADGQNQDARETDYLLPHHELEDSEQGSQVGDQEESSTTGILNLLGVDVPRVSDFCGWNVDLARGVVQITVSASILVTIIGWWSTLAAFTVPLLLDPLTRAATGYYLDREVIAMQSRDNKANLVAEALQGIRQIKFSASETRWEARILAARDKELHAQWQVYFWSIILKFTWMATPTLIGATALSVYAALGGHLTASVAFTALSLFTCLERTITALPSTITEMIDAMVSASRIEDYLNLEEKPLHESADGSIEFCDASIAWPSSSAAPGDFELRGLDLRFPSKALSVIYGKTGAGKSLLLTAIIGEAEVRSGSVSLPHSPPMHLRNSEVASEDNWIIPQAFAYVSQIPWIENATIKEGILFGLPYHHDRYIQVVQACALQDDIAFLPGGEDTEVGATGINLSGGQRWRVALARALYSRAGILVLDDIFSAVDSHVGRHLLEHAILGPLGFDRTTILVTHHVMLVERYATYLIELRDHTTFSVTHKVPDQFRQDGANPNNNEMETLESDSNAAKFCDGQKATEVPRAEPRKFIQDETRAHGQVSWRVYETYFTNSGGRLYWISTLVILFLGGLTTIIRFWWLALWTETYILQDMTATVNEQNQHSLSFYLSIYLLTSFASIALVAVKIIVVYLASIRAARHLFEITTLKVIRAPLRWLDTQPTGRILNRFVGDFAMIDTKLGDSMLGSINGVFSLLIIIIAALFVSAWVIIPIAILTVLASSIVYLYLDATRDIKRLDSNARSPIFDLIGSTTIGLTTIRSFGRMDDYMMRMYMHLDRFAQTTWYVALANKWMAFRQGLVGVLFALFVAIGVIYFDQVDASLAGFALSFALDFSDATQVTTSRFASTELSMNATERVLEYADLETEKLTGVEAATTWPLEGAIAVRDLKVGYAEHLEAVLKGVSFSVEPCERIGIVGRTGSGKSSLTLALFRFLEARQGSITIDGVDISTLRLEDLRSRLAIIPQDPVLFSGTLRSNLDRFNEYTDFQLTEALERVNPARILLRAGQRNANTHRSSVFDRGLECPIVRSGSNLSQGEKQLICLGRAILTKPKILILDEATSAVDMETDALIQQSIREDFSSATLLVVAHRLSTVADFDKILVMRDGQIAEFDRPEVLARKKGEFWGMLNDSGEAKALKHLLQ